MSLLAQVCCKTAEIAHGSATVVDKVTKAKIPMVTGGYNGGTLDVNRTANQWDLAMQVLFNVQKLQPLL